jgi:aspartate kinase
VIVMKFGGTSVGGSKEIRRVADIVRARLHQHPVVVVSAVGGITNRLFKIGDLALSREPWQPEYNLVASKHRDILKELGLPADLVDRELDELHALSRGIELIRELTPRTRDYLASFGERMSVRVVAAHFNQVGLPASAHDAFDVGLVTDAHFGGARPLPEADERIRSALKGAKDTPVVTGYIGKAPSGEITTLGRGGSDYSASIFGAALEAEEIQIWTDVDGVMTADPRIVPGARFLPVLSFAEAAELAFYGAKVIHPATMIPAVKRGIPIRVVNSYRPEFEGTLIVDRLAGGQRGVKSVTSKDSIAVVNIVAAPMLNQYGFLARIGDVFARNEVVVDMVATSEVSVSMTTDGRANLKPVVEDLSRFSNVTVERDMSIISIVGEELRERVGLAAQVFGAIARAGINLEMVSYGATRINLSFLVRQDRAREVVAILHEQLFGPPAGGR